MSFNTGRGFPLPLIRDEWDPLLMRDILQLVAQELGKVPEPFKAPTLLNSWVNYDAAYNPAGYYKDPWGRVHLRGAVKNGTAIGTAIFTLAAGYRPPFRQLHVVDSNNAHGRVDVLADGTVLGVAGSTAWVSLDGISFRT